uniref:Pentacotripeptide-repeat region of PRORP domain-containing protein n=1 Tax=Chrysotila carterae TaxID=13221 RepID=A0A7S4B2N7_CHRCT
MTKAEQILRVLLSSPVSTHVFLRSQLVENALVIGATLVGSFRQGCELVAQAEEHAGLMLSPRSYAALMQLGLAEQRWLEVLGLLGRVRSRGMTPSAGMLRASMRAAANIGDWGAVCRLFNELAGAEKSSEALELIGSPKVLAELRAELGGAEEDAKRLVSLTPADADAIRLAMRAHCARGDTALVTAALLRMRELGCGLGVANYVDIFELAVKKRALSALQAITPQDVAFSVGSALEPKIFALRNTAANMPRADKELLVLVAGAALAAGAIAAASHVNSAPDIDHLSF